MSGEPKAFRDEPCPGVLHDIERERPRLRHDVIWCPVCRDAEAGLNTGRVIVAVTA